MSSATNRYRAILIHVAGIVALLSSAGCPANPQTLPDGGSPSTRGLIPDGYWVFTSDAPNFSPDCFLVLDGRVTAHWSGCAGSDDLVSATMSGTRSAPVLMFRFSNLQFLGTNDVELTLSRIGSDSYEGTYLEHNIDGTLLGIIDGILSR